jgi:hypothetical protein
MEWAAVGLDRTAAFPFEERVCSSNLAAGRRTSLIDPGAALLLGERPIVCSSLEASRRGEITHPANRANGPEHRRGWHGMSEPFRRCESRARCHFFLNYGFFKPQERWLMAR